MLRSAQRGWARKPARQSKARGVHLRASLDPSATSLGPLVEWVIQWMDRRHTGWGMTHCRGLFGLSLLRGLSAVIVIGLSASAASAQWTVINLHPPGADHSRANGVEGGQQAGGASFGGFGHAGLWSGSGASWTDLHPASAQGSGLSAIGDGQQVGYASVGGTVSASLWSGSAGSWVNLHTAGATASEALGVSGGHQVGYLQYGVSFQEYHATLWSGTAASAVNLHPSWAIISFAYAVHGGRQVGWAGRGGTGARPMLWNGTAASGVDLTPTGAAGGVAHGMDAVQQVGSTFYTDLGETHAALWSGTAASWVDLNPAGSIFSQAYGVSGGMQVGTVQIGDDPHASVWSGGAGSWVDLHAFLPPEFTSSFAAAVWSDASFTYVTGYGSNSATGRTEALLWRVPAPSGMMVLGLGLVAAAGRRRQTTEVGRYGRLDQ